MAKRKPEEPAKGAPAWQSTFADLMNLLLCFFVLLFAMSTISEEKLRDLAASFSDSFSIFSAGGSSFGEGVLLNNGVSQLSQLDSYMTTMGKAAETDIESDIEVDQSTEGAYEQLQQEMLEDNEKLAEMIEESLSEQNMNGDIAVDFTSQYVELTLNGALLFDSGKATLKSDSDVLMEKVSVLLQKYAEGTIEVEGHTDNVPIHTSQFKSNNELSSARALTVFEYLVDNTNLDPARIKHSGRGEYIPVADNSTVEGRTKNRRVEIKIYHPLSMEQ